MTPSLSFSSLPRPTEEFTCNGEALGSAVASFDLLNLSGVIVSFAFDCTSTRSLGGTESARGLYEGDFKGEMLTAATADSSALAIAGLPDGCAHQPVSPTRDSAVLDLSALLMLLGGLLEALAETGSAYPTDPGQA